MRIERIIRDRHIRGSDILTVIADAYPTFTTEILEAIISNGDAPPPPTTGGVIQSPTQHASINPSANQGQQSQNSGAGANNAAGAALIAAGMALMANPPTQPDTHYFTAQDRGGNVTQTIEIPLGTNQWTYESPADVSGYTFLGTVIYAKNLTVKTLKVQSGLEVQTVTQTTTVVWKDGQGQIQAKSFVSLIGTHSRPVN